MAECDWTMQRLADIIDAPVDCPKVVETTALGAAYLAGLQAGFACPNRRMQSPRLGAGKQLGTWRLEQMNCF